jgi:transcriptional regulator with PAS, ATPase and Fis domain
MFFDEVGELTPSVQVKLLGAIQERRFTPLGSNEDITVSIRWVAATNRDLEKAIETGSFREDLFYRLNVVSVEMPPLRERGEDISLLASYFVTKCCDKHKRPRKGISREAIAYLMNYRWPGNVRELENVIERAVIMGLTDEILPEDLPEAVLETEPPQGIVLRYHEAVREAKRQILLNAIQQAGAKKTEAAKRLGIHPNNLHRMIRDLNLKVD